MHVICHVQDKQHLFKTEQYFIDFFDAFNSGYNCSPYATGGSFLGTKIICLNTNEIFESIKDAAEFMNLSRSMLRRVVIGQYKDVSGYAFRPIDKNGQIMQVDYAPYQNPRRKVLCVETVQIFKNAPEAERFFGMSHKSVTNVLCGKRLHTHGYTFQQIDENNNKIPSPVICTDSRQRRQVRCIENDQIFPNLLTAANFIGCHERTLLQKIRTNHQIKGLTFIFI